MRRRAFVLAPFIVKVADNASYPVTVVASFTILADFAARVCGNQVSVRSLVDPDGDVHIYQPRPSDVRQLHDATIVLENGLLLEPWLDRLLRSVGASSRVVVASTGVATRTFVEGARRVTDPHIWQDPTNAGRMVATIVDAVATVDPANADAYRARAAQFIAEIELADREIGQAFEAIPKPKRQIITSHDAFGYYGARYGIEFRAAQGINTEAEPTARDLARLAAQIERDHIRVVFIENMTDPRIAAALAREAGAIVGPKVYSDSLSLPTGPASSYLAMLKYNTTQFVRAMSRQ